MEINSIVIVGRLTRDAELKYTQGGLAIIKGSIAVNRRVKDGDAWKDEASFFDWSSMGKAAEAVHKFLTKGKQIGLQGELRQNRWEQDGQARSKVEIFAHGIQLLGSTSQQDQGAGRPVYEPGSRAGQELKDYQEKHMDQASGAGFEDDIPF